MNATSSTHDRELIEQLFADRSNISPRSDPAVIDTINRVIDTLNRGEERVAEPRTDGWHVNEWLKKAVLLYFRINPNQVFDDGSTRYFDKVPLKYAQFSHEDFQQNGVRVVPPATVRHGAWVAPDCVLMPSFINIGAYVDSGSMIDTWASVGSCAQIGRNVHLSGGAGIGGVLEPLQAAPTIIGNNCFIGARSEIVEGVIVEDNAVISMGVFIGQSTRIYDRENDEILYGRVPAGAVVVPGSLPADNGKYALNCAVIVKRVDEKTRAKVSLNELLRTWD
ncbi:MAG: 2,3,4,5-tetrahydropyridine-2,6-dicarboxylate N-succinyltransferase [Gammaproteobacteria bacterium]|nr:2,3,4,5-tetrahydropyridine-2,6-dicarboxylate N-succinyltransferase [Gammaproteobacteria bacterium]